MEFITNTGETVEVEYTYDPGEQTNGMTLMEIQAHQVMDQQQI